MKSVTTLAKAALLFFAILGAVHTAHADEVATADRGTIKFTVKGGKKPGEYGGKLNKRSMFSARKIGNMTLLSLRIIHEREDKTTIALTATLQLDGEFKAGKYDLKGKMAQAGVLPNGVAHGDDRFFTANAMQGTGTLEVESVDAKKGTIKGTFTIAQGDLIIKGSFDKKK